MASLTPQSIADAGTIPTFNAVNASDIMTLNTGRQYLHVKNGNAATCTVTVTAVTNCSHGFLHTMTVSILTTAEKLIGPFPTNRFGASPVVAYSVQSSVTAAYVTL